MIPIETKFGFPLFTRSSNNVYLGNDKKLVISDMWAFGDYIIKKKNFEKEFMSSLLEQAKNFYLAAESSPLKSKPLLYYYSFLNLAKVVINIEKRYGRTRYLHGLGENHNSRFSHSTITIADKKIHLKNVSAEFSEIIDNTVIAAPITTNVKDYLIHCVGIHRAYSEIYNVDEMFYRLGELCLYKDGKRIISKFKVNCLASDLPLLAARDIHHIFLSIPAIDIQRKQ